jgi:hypothetical protein
LLCVQTGHKNDDGKRSKQTRCTCRIPRFFRVLFKWSWVTGDWICAPRLWFRLPLLQAGLALPADSLPLQHPPLALWKHVCRPASRPMAPAGPPAALASRPCLLKSLSPPAARQTGAALWEESPCGSHWQVPAALSTRLVGPVPIPIPKWRRRRRLRGGDEAAMTMPAAGGRNHLPAGTAAWHRHRHRHRHRL